MASDNLTDFSRDLGDGVDAYLEGVAVAVKKKVVFSIYGDLIRTTPRKTGRAQNSWSVGNAGASEPPPPEGLAYYPPPDIAEGMAGVDFGAGQDVDIYSLLSYMPALDEGHSGQAPAGMTSIALANLRHLET